MLCNGADLQVASFRTLAGHGLVNVIDGYIVVTEAGRDLLDRLPSPGTPNTKAQE
jgi:hypothetical protein